MESITLQPGAPCKDGNEIRVCFDATVEIGNAYYVSIRCEDNTGSCECCNSAFTTGYYVDLAEAKRETWSDCVNVPLSAWDACVGCACCRIVLYLNQGDIGIGTMKASVVVPQPNPMPDC